MSWSVLLLGRTLRNLSWDAPRCAPRWADQLAKICFISALPFALLAYFDNAWSSNDAGPVCLAAWIAVCVAFSFKCTICVIGLAVTFFPFILSALLAHGFGAICRLFKDRICGPAAD